MKQKMKDKFSELEKKLGIAFKKKDFLKEALTHRSYINENPDWGFSQNERLEYLGDAVLELVVSEFLFHTYPGYQEGQLTSFRAALVNYQMLAQVAKEISLEKYIFVSRGEAKDNGRGKEVILANAIEALFGAVYLDQGYEVVAKLIKKIVLKHLKKIIANKLYRDPKSLLQEIVQEKFKVTPTYKVLEEKLPDHQKVFLVGVLFGEKI